MADPPSPVKNEEKETAKSGSFTKFLGGSPSSKKSSSNSFSKLFRRKGSSSRKGDDSGGEPDSPERGENEANTEEDKDHGLVEEVKEVVETAETAFDDLIHRKKKDTSVHEPTNDAPISIESTDRASSGETKEGKHHHNFLGKVKEGLDKAKEGLKEDFGKAKEEITTILQKGKSHDHDDHKKPLHITTNSSSSSSSDDDDSKKKKKTKTKKKNPSIDDEVKAPSLAQRLQEEVVAVISTIDVAKKGKTSQEEEEGKEIIKEKKEEKKEEEKKKEDNCMTSLAQGLQNLCSWGSKKED